jgi:hypothetical protein
MHLQVNPNELILIGENSFIRLGTDGSNSASTRCSHWRVLWTPAGSGHALFVDSGITAGVKVYADRVPLVRFLQKEIEYLLYKPFGDTNLPVIPATFEREGTPPDICSELVHAGKGNLRLSWSAFLEPFNFAADPGYDNRPIGVQTTFFPAGTAKFTVGDQSAAGAPWKMDRGGKACTTACLAWCETWYRPR